MLLIQTFRFMVQQQQQQQQQNKAKNKLAMVRASPRGVAWMLLTDVSEC